jgi:Tfp pilus assembly protein PilW
MRLSVKYDDRVRGQNRRLSGMTLVEVMIAFSLMLMVLAAILAANLIGLSENQYLSAKAGASNTSRQAVDTMMNDIRSAKGFMIGNISNTNLTTLTPVTNGLIQGTALQVYPILISTNESIDYTKFIQYSYVSNVVSGFGSTPSSGVLYRYDSTNGITSVVASNLINSLIFYSENYAGSNQWSPTYKNVVHTTLQFCEFQYPLTMIGSNYLFDYYRIDCRATPHLPDGP